MYQNYHSNAITLHDLLKNYHTEFTFKHKTSLWVDPPDLVPQTFLSCLSLIICMFDHLIVETRFYLVRVVNLI